MRRQGFTLIEMLITVAVSAILLGIAVPSFQNLLVANRISTQANELVTDLALARSEAVKRGVKVSICTSSNGSTCTASTWNQGRIIFTDTGTAGSLDGEDTVLRVSSAVEGGMNLSSSPSTINQYVQYSPTGRALASGSFTLCKKGYKGQVISIGNTGRVSAQKTSSTCA